MVCVMCVCVCVYAGVSVCAFMCVRDNSPFLGRNRCTLSQIPLYHGGVDEMGRCEASRQIIASY